MQRFMLYAKIHRATVTQADLHYVGSLTIDRDLMDAAGLLPGEQVDVVDVDNGNRLTTYAIEGERGSGIVCINGAAARLISPGDTVIIIAYAAMDDAEARTFEPQVVFVDERQPDRRGRPRRWRRPRRLRAQDLRGDPAPPWLTGWPVDLRLPGPPRRARARAGPRSADVIVVGSGIAGLTTALRLRQRVDRVLLVTKTVLHEGSTQWAQGGIAAALDPGDSPEEHLHDTLVAGVRHLRRRGRHRAGHEGPARVRELVALGAEFDRDAEGEIKLTREGGHHRDRIAHAGGDATGKEISRALIAALHQVQDDPGIEVIEHALVVDLLQDDESRGSAASRCTSSARARWTASGPRRRRAVVLATGGLGQVYSATTNPSVATGDGMAAALRAGAVLADVEFVQFHPTVLWLGAGSSGQQPLISEAVRGEGAFLVDRDGVRFMQGRHPLADLAPRDVVSRAIVDRMQHTGERPRLPRRPAPRS